MKIKTLLHALIAIVFVFSSCKNKVEKQVMGVWVIDKITYDNQDIKLQLLANAMTFRKDYSCDIPIIKVEDNHTDKQKGEWRVNEKKGKVFLFIKSTNDLFNGEFKIEKVWQEHDNISQGELLKMIISSDHIQLQCARDASDVPI